ncbi:site-2 protease family protein [Demequina sp. NBRC 110055]|uniref:site-2 protease family protein n=1 Tax=Demequina sp. NBRC 110055 TaxID=1570344 RepID=UPI0009FD1DAF|nr:site-2 protease family protein [Demequina sp. NBRC 110055]
MTQSPRPTRGLTLGRIFGARIVVQYSTLLMLVILALLFATSGGVELTRRTFTVGLILAVLLFVSVFLHEVAHAAAARSFKRDVNEIVLTLWGGHTSYDARALTPTVMGVTAAAGPVANLVLAGLAWIPLAWGALEPTLRDWVLGDVTLYLIVQWVAWANLVLAIFNALPGIPMDGGRVLESIVWAVTGNRYTGMKAAAWAGRVIAVGVVVVALGIPVLGGRSPDLFDLLWAMLVFAILWPAASNALKVAQALGKRASVTARDLTVAAVTVPHHVTVDQARSAAEAAGAVEVVVLAVDGAAAGHFPAALTDAVEEADRATTGLQSVTMPLPRGAAIDAGAGGDALVDALQQWWGRTDVWVAVDRGEIVGVVRLADAMKALQ